LSPQDPLVVYAATTLSGLIRSSDGGKSWRPVGLGPQPVLSLAVHRDRAGIVYAGLVGGVVASSTDGGVSWRNRRISGATVNVQSLAVAPSDAQFIYAATNAGLARSVNAGDTWRLLAIANSDTCPTADANLIASPTPTTGTVSGRYPATSGTIKLSVIRGKAGVTCSETTDQTVFLCVALRRSGGSG